MNERNSVNMQICAAVAATGVAFTLFLSAYFEHGARKQTQLLLKQTHRQTMQLLARDLDDIRAQLQQIFGEKYARHFQYLTFQKNAYGRLGVRGMKPVTAWTPIANAGSSAFRAALPEGFAANVQVYDSKGHFIDANRAYDAKSPAARLTSAVPGTNLVLRSKTIQSNSPFKVLGLLLLSALFWGELAVFLYLFLERELIQAPKTKVVIRAPLHDVTMSDGVFANYLNHRLVTEFNSGAALALARVTLARSEILPGFANLMSKQMSALGFYCQRFNGPGELLVAFEAERMEQIQNFLRKFKELSQTKVLDLKGLELTGALIYSSLPAPEAKSLLAAVRTSRTYLLAGESLEPNVRPTFLKFTKTVDTATHIMNYDRAQALRMLGENHFGKKPMFLPTLVVVAREEEPTYVIPFSPKISPTALVTM